MAPPRVYEVYRPAPQRTSNATAIIRSMRVSFQLCFTASRHANSHPVYRFSTPIATSFLAARSGPGQAMTQHGKHRRKSPKVFRKATLRYKGNLRTNIEKLLVNGMCRLREGQPGAYATV